MPLPPPWVRPRPRRWRALTAVVLAVLLAHAAGLWPRDEHPDPTPAHPPGTSAKPPPPPPPRLTLQWHRPASPPAATAAPAEPVATPQPLATAPRLPKPDTTPAAPSAPARPGPDDADAGPDSNSPPESSPPPTYATQLPDSAVLRYTLRRGAAQGQAELRWTLDGERYALSLRSEVAGTPALSSTSTGRIDEHGLAPERHADQRRGREVRAVNFQRDSARITFSGPQLEHALPAGAQDRLSWMLQLPAILQANPALREPGSPVRVFVAGPRGDAETWLFTVQGRENVMAADGSLVDTLHLKREPRRPYDTTVDVWLDPNRQHLPLRAVLRVRPTGEGSELLLEGASAP